MRILETNLNKIDHIPIASIFISTPIRIGLGITQIVSGVALAIISIIFRQSNCNFGDQLFYRGVTNLLRSCISVAPIFGNIILSIYDDENSDNYIKSFVEYICYNAKKC